MVVDGTTMCTWLGFGENVRLNAGLVRSPDGHLGISHWLDPNLGLMHVNALQGGAVFPGCVARARPRLRRRRLHPAWQQTTGRTFVAVLH